MESRGLADAKPNLANWHIGHAIPALLRVGGKAPQTLVVG